MFFQHGSESGDLLCGIDLSGRVVGGVDDNSAGLFRDRRIESLHIQREIGFTGNTFQRAAEIFSVKTVFHKIGCRAKHFISGIQDGAEKHIDPARGTAGHQQPFRRDFNCLFHAHFCGECGTDIGQTCIGHITESERLIGFFRQFRHGSFHSGGCGNIRITQTVIVHIGGTVFLFQFDPRLKHTADPG